MDKIKGFLYNLATDRYNGFIPGILKFFLWIVSLVYGLGVIILAWLCRLRAFRLPCKVISVGNITLGGTGKTTLVEFIASYLNQNGHTAAVISRGYKRVDCCRLSGENPANSYETIGDEPYMLMLKLKNIPVIVGSDRIRAAQSAIRDYGADTVILDDGFQQWRIKKDLEIVAIDATASFGNRHMIPRGILREPLACLKRAQLFVLTKTNLSPDVRRITGFLKAVNPAAQIFETEHIPVGFYLIHKPDTLLGIDALKGKKVILVSGIGDPVSFESLVRENGMTVGSSFVFPDHHPYTTGDVRRIMHDAREMQIDTVITTEKDSVRLLPVLEGTKPAGAQVWVLRIALRLKSDEQRFYNRLRGIYSA